MQRIKDETGRNNAKQSEAEQSKTKQTKASESKRSERTEEHAKIKQENRRVKEKLLSKKMN